MSNDMFGDLKEQILRNANISEEKIKKHLNESKPVAKPAAKTVAKPAPKKTLTSEIEKFKTRIMEEINQLVKDNLEDDKFGGTPPAGGEMDAALPPDTGAEGDQLAPPATGDETPMGGADELPPADGAEGGAEGPEVQALYDAAKEIFSKYGSDSEMIDKILNRVITELVPNAEVETQEMGGDDEVGMDGDMPPVDGADAGMDDDIMGGGLEDESGMPPSDNDMDDEALLPKR